MYLNINTVIRIKTVESLNNTPELKTTEYRYSFTNKKYGWINKGEEKKKKKIINVELHTNNDSTCYYVKSSDVGTSGSWPNHSHIEEVIDGNQS